MNPLAFIFPGQGAHYLGMAKTFYDSHAIARQTFEEADQTLGVSLTKICFEGPVESLNKTEMTQPAILTASVAMLRVFRSYGFDSTMTAGLSLGEYTALVHSESLLFKDAVELVRNRGRFMQKAVPENQGGMAAILGLDPKQVDPCLESCREFGYIAVANYNCPGQIVLSGELTAVRQSLDICRKKGAKKAVLMPVSAPFHTSMLDPAGQQLNDCMKDVTFRKPNQAFYSNVTGKAVAEAESIKPLLVSQVSHPVKWENCLLSMMDDGCTTFVEIGPSNSLTGFVKRTSRHHGRLASGVHIETVEQMELAAEILTKEGYHGTK